MLLQALWYVAFISLLGTLIGLHTRRPDVTRERRLVFVMIAVALVGPLCGVW